MTGKMIRFGLLLILTVMFCTVTYGQEDDCHDDLDDDCFVCLVDFNIFVSHGGQFCGGSDESLTEQIQFHYRTIHGNWQFLESYNRSEMVDEYRVKVTDTSDTQLQFRWIQNNMLESPAWAIDDIVIFCTDNCQKDISFEETSETLETSLLECHSGVIHRGTASCSDTEHSLLMNGTEREVRTTPFSLNNCRNNVNKKFFNTCKECEMELLFNTTWPTSYISTELTSPCLISERNITRTCDASQAWIPSPIDTYDRCARNNSVCLGPSLSHGLAWSTTLVNETVRIQCSRISEIFWSGLDATRKCLDGGVWDEVDMSQCTMKNDKSSLIIYSSHLNMSDGSFLSESQIVTELEGLLKVPIIGHKVNTKNAWDSGAIFIMTLTNNLSLVQDISDSIDRHLERFHKKNFRPSELVKMIPNGVCHCKGVVSVSGEAYFRVLETNMCLGLLHPPCVYDSDEISSKCNRPFYTGNDTLCGQDTDQDGIPDAYLGCDGTSCQQDVCPWIYDVDNNPNLCSVGTNGCDMEIDQYFGIQWPWARENYTLRRVCPDGTGSTSRQCNHLGNWVDDPPDVRNCSSFVYQELLQNVINSVKDGLNPESVNIVLNSLAFLVTSSNYSTFPLDMQTIHFVISEILNVVEKAPNLLEEEEFDDTIVGVISDILNIKNEPGFDQLTDINRTENQMLIVNSEKLGILLASNTDTKKTFVRENIVLSVERRNASSDIGPIKFPLQDLSDEFNNTEIYDNTEINVTDSFIFIPASVIRERAKSYADNILPIANIIYFNLERFLPRTEHPDNPSNNTHVPASVVISSQVGNTSSSVSSDDPVILNFQYTADPNSNNTRCAFWNFDLMQNGGDGGWDITNVSVAYTNSTYIRCNSTHLTCFAVLVDIHGGTSDINKGEAVALSAVSYAGCGISMICLLGAISLIVLYRKTLLKELPQFAHLNLAVALFLGLTVFAVGIETATKNKIACTVVAALLHYFFTAVFSWMLCEGILLYVLLVKVFSTGFVKKKRLYFLLGWGIPLPIVGISVGIAHNDYGTDEFCWISFEKDVVWGFVGPMLLIIVINTIFLIMALRVLLKSKSHNRTTEEIKQRDIVKSMIKATVLLLPLLGLTWIFGLLTVNEHLTVFAWLFTVLNSLQGLFLFIFHVIRNEKVRNKIKNTAVFKAMKNLISVKDRVSYTKYKTGTSTKLNADFGNVTTKPSSTEKENGGNHQLELIKTSSSPQPLELLQQQTNSSDDILCTAV